MNFRHLSAVACFVFTGCLAVVQGVTLEVKDGNSTCIKAELTATFSITYDTSNGTRTVNVALPDSAAVGNGSSCGREDAQPELEASFGDGHTFSLSFSTDGNQYRVANLSLTYNLNDSATFPQSSSTETVTLVTNSSGIAARMNSTYRCLSSTTVSLKGTDVTVTLSNMKMEAYMLGGDLSQNESVCMADQSATTAPPTAAPTEAPTPAPTPSNPERGNYNVTNGNGTICLLARMGLQLNITHSSKSQNKTVSTVVNLHPNRTSFSGSCGPTSSTLLLTENGTILSFTFTLNSTTNKYHLSAVNVSASWPDMTAPFSASNSTLDYLRGTLGRSYMCSATQTYAIVNTFSLNTVGVRVQPFGVRENQFGTADECPVDQDNMLIPIIVGAALAGLVLIVLIAYLIGRKRSHAGYQTI
ncbi:lysosome-associated membrane glycoprotein 1a [Chanos chanos]|uniref:Lysosome-associated membrane glycoprotein 1 n=1 Tax=Chanos chanos TaxID=29144 RepID=A0A6J2VXG6_CHACN|nr:lysosome-associated membrane glycoprotein 1 [Chanos chanos]